MRYQAVRNALALFALAMVFTAIALAQPSTSEIDPGNTVNHSWESAQTLGSSDHKLMVVSIDQPHHAQTCHVQSFTKDNLVCTLAFGRHRTYLRKQVGAIIRPNDDALRVQLLLGFNGALGTAIWGTIVLAAVCPACAAATAFAALLIFGAAGAIAIGDGQPNMLLYLARAETMSNIPKSLRP